MTRTNALEALVISGWVRGLSDRDTEAALAEVLGAEAALSRSTVSRICQAIRDEFAVWSARRLDDVVLDYPFLDASNFKMHPNSPAEPVLAAWGITTDGKAVFIGLAPVGTESTDAWAGFLTELKERGLRPPLLGISDGAPGLIAAMEAVFAESLAPEVPDPPLPERGRQGADPGRGRGQGGVLVDLRRHRRAAGRAGGGRGHRLARQFADRYGQLYPKAVACLSDDFASLTVHLRFPRQHQKRIRHSNFIERTFGESRRRVKVIGRLPGETSCLSLVWAVLDRASRGWRGVTQSSETVRLLQDLRRQLLEPPVDLGGRRTRRTGTAPAAKGGDALIA